MLAVFSWILEVNASKEKKKSMSVFVLELRIRSGLHSRKVELSHVKYFHTFVSTPNYVSPIGANNMRKEDEVGIGVNWIENFQPVWQRTIRSAFKIKRDLYHQHHGYMSCYLLSFEKAKKNFCINWIPKLMVQFFSLFWHCYCFPSSLLQWIARIQSGLKRTPCPTTRCWTHTGIFDQKGKWLIQIVKVTKNVTLK